MKFQRQEFQDKESDTFETFGRTISPNTLFVSRNVLPNDFSTRRGSAHSMKVGAAVQQLCRRAAACFCGSRWAPRVGAAGALGSCRGEDLLDLLEALLVAFVTVACSVSTRWVTPIGFLLPKSCCSVCFPWPRGRRAALLQAPYLQHPS